MLMGVHLYMMGYRLDDQIDQLFLATTDLCRVPITDEASMKFLGHGLSLVKAWPRCTISAF
jgi:hypothetical protein